MKLLMIGFLIVALTLVGTAALAVSLYEQEGTSEDGYSGINAAGQAPSGGTSFNNWKYQYGSYSFFGIYEGSDGWNTVSESGDCELLIEADIEMYCYEEIRNHKIYFHIGDLSTATADDLTAHIDGHIETNNGQYVGLMIGPDKTLEEVDGTYTGRIIDAMVGTRDTWRDMPEKDKDEGKFDVVITLNDFSGSGWRGPDNYGEGAHATIHDTLWWLIRDGNPGSFDYQWKVRLDPDTYQADGNYHFDPTVVVAPVL